MRINFYREDKAHLIEIGIKKKTTYVCREKSCYKWKEKSNKKSEEKKVTRRVGDFFRRAPMNLFLKME